MIDTIVFDVGGVLADYHRNDYYLRLGYSADLAEKLKKATQLHPAWVEYDRNVLNDEEVRNRFKKDAPELSEEIDLSLIHMNGLVTKRDSSIPWIMNLKERGYRLYVLSNFGRTAFEDCQDALDFVPLMDGCFWSFQHHVIKPDDACFLTMLYEFQIDPQKAVFIDDTKINTDAAATVGMHTILYQTLSHAQQELNALLS